MLFRATTLFVLTLTAVWADAQPVFSTLKAEEKPLPLFPTASPLDIKTAPVIQEVVAAPPVPQPQQAEHHQPILKTENVQPVQPEVTAVAQDVAADTQAQDLQVLDFVLTNQVVNREPQGTLENFAAGSKRGIAFARLQADTNTEVTFVWYRNNREYLRHKAPVQTAKQWRTFSSVSLHSGDWKVQLLGKEGEVLAEKTFSMK